MQPPTTSRDVLRALGIFLAWVAGVALAIGVILLLAGPLYSKSHDGLCTALILIAATAMLGMAPFALAAKLVFARTLLAWIFGAATAADPPAPGGG